MADIERPVKLKCCRQMLGTKICSSPTSWRNVRLVSNWKQLQGDGMMEAFTNPLRCLPLLTKRSKHNGKFSLRIQPHPKIRHAINQAVSVVSHASVPQTPRVPYLSRPCFQFLVFVLVTSVTRCWRHGSRAEITWVGWAAGFSLLRLRDY